MTGVAHITQRVAAFLQKRNAAYCESCLVERLLIASRLALKAALETDRFSTRIGICPDCKTRKQVIGCRSGAGNALAKESAAAEGARLPGGLVRHGVENVAEGSGGVNEGGDRTGTPRRKAEPIRPSMRRKRIRFRESYSKSWIRRPAARRSQPVRVVLTLTPHLRPASFDYLLMSTC